MKKIVTILPGLNMGGAEHMAYELIKNLDREEYKNVVICYGQRMNTPLEKQMEDICKVIYVGISRRIGIKAMLKVLAVIWHEKPDIIHAHMGGVTFAIPYSKIMNIPLVLTIHTKPEKAFSTRNEKSIRKYINNKDFVLVAVSKENYEYVKQYFGNDSNCTYVNNGVDIHRYKPQKHKEFTFINVARQDDNKNQIAIIKAFEKVYKVMPNTRLFLVGDGPCHIELIKLVDELGLSNSIELPGMIADPTSYYNQSDVYVQSSHREAMPLSVLEAMAAGLPIISTNVGGMCDVVKSNGFLIDDNDDIIDSLYAYMIRLQSASNDTLVKMGYSSKEIVKAFSSEEMVRKYTAIYKKLMQ